MDAIVLRKVSKFYGRQSALQDISLTIPGGECVGIIGPNGAGKTTLVRLLLGLLKPSAGEITVSGFVPFRRDAAFRKSTAFLLDENVYWENLTVREHFSLLSNFYENLRGDGWLIPLRTWGLEEHRDKRISNLSKGLAKRAALASAFGREYEVLILDEPFGDLDLTAQKVLHDQLDEAKRAGQTILITFQDPWQVMKMIDRIIILNKGAIIADESTTSRKIADLDAFQLRDYILETIGNHQITG